MKTSEFIEKINTIDGFKAELSDDGNISVLTKDGLIASVDSKSEYIWNPYYFENLNIVTRAYLYYLIDEYVTTAVSEREDKKWTISIKTEKGESFVTHLFTDHNGRIKIEFEICDKNRAMKFSKEEIKEFYKLGIVSKICED